MAVRDWLRNTSQKLLDRTDLDEKIGAGVRTLGQNARALVQPANRQAISQNFQQAFKPLTQMTPKQIGPTFNRAANETSYARKNLNLSQPLDYLARRGESNLRGFGDLATGLANPGQIKPFFQGIRGIGTLAAGVALPTALAEIVSSGRKPGTGNDWKRRIAGGFSEMVGQTKAHNVADRNWNLNTPLGDVSFDPLKTAGSMAGFVMRPENKAFFKFTESILPAGSAFSNFKKWTAITGTRGAIEDIVLSIPDLPDNATLEQKAKIMAQAAGFGAAAEILMRGSGEALSKAAGNLGKTRFGELTKAELAKAYDEMQTFKRRWNVKTTWTDPVTEKRYTEPMWKFKVWEANQKLAEKAPVGMTIKETPGATKPQSTLHDIDKNLIAQHNIKPQGVLHAEKMGGLPLPSIAIARKEYPLQDFGDITLLGGKELYDPAIRSNKIYNADAYSPRYPSVNYTYIDKAADERLTPIIDQARKYFGNNSSVIPSHIDNFGWPYKAILDGGEFESRGIQTLENNKLIRGYFAMTKGATPDADYKQIDGLIDKNRNEYTEFVENLYNNIAGEERLFKGYTNAGNRRYAPHTLENVVKEMKANMGEGEGFNYGLGTVRSKVAKKYNTLSQIKSDRNKIISSDEFEKVRKSLDDEWSSIMEDAVSKSGRDEFGEYDRFTNVLMDGIKNRNIKATLDEYGFKGVDVGKIEKFLDKVRNAPTEYFEVKPQRAVGLNEFKVATIPEDTPPKVIESLRKQGIKIYRYGKDNRSQVIRKAAEENELAFGAVAGIEVYQDEDGEYKVRYNAENAAAGMALMAGVKYGGKYLKKNVAQAPKSDIKPTVKIKPSEKVTAPITTNQAQNASRPQTSVLPTETGKPRTANKPKSDSRTNASSKPIVTGNPIKDDISGVKPSGIIARLREVVQDNWIRVKNLQRQKGVKVADDASNPYLNEELYHGRVGARVEDVKAKVNSYDQDILETSKRIGIPDADLKVEVNRYLQAKHTPERNKVHGDGAAGMTNAEAKQALAEISSSKAGKEIERLATQVKDLNNQTLDILYESQVIDKALYDTLRKTYKNHVPLQRIMDENANIADILVGKGFNVKGSGVKKAKGSNREVADILTNVVANLDAAIVRAEKNRVNLSTLRFARNNPQLGVFEEIKPKAIGKTFDGRPIIQEVKDPQVLSIRENGKPVYLRINDPKLAVTLQGIGNEKLPGVFRFIQAFTGFYSGLHTRFNPEFAVSNIVRDTQEMAVFMASQKDIGFKGAAKAIGRDPSSAKAVIDSIRGIDSEGAKLYKQMRMDGGTTGGMALSTRQKIELDIKEIETLNRSNPRKAASKILEAIDNWNTVFEDSTRFSVYKEALAKGMSRPQAASLAKNSTVNFNKKGTGGPIINALYMFSNASIQGSVKMLRAMKNPKVAAAVTTIVGTAVFSANNWNDEVDPDWRDKVGEWDRDANLIVMLPSSEGSKYITIPVSWGLKPIKVGADAAYDIATGQEGNLGEAAVRIASSAFDAYNPAGGNDMAQVITPTILDVPTDLARNKSWSGGTIKPDWMKGLPASEQRFANTGDTLTGKAAIGVANTLSKGRIEVSPEYLLYAYNQYIGGVGKFASRTINTITSAVKGDSLVAKEIPFANRFFKTKSEEQIQKSVAYKKQDDFFESLKKYETGSEEQKEAIRNYLRQQNSDSERQSTLFKLRDRGIDTKGISFSASKLGASNITQSDKVSFVDYKDQPQNILDKVALAAQGMTKDPGNTIKAIFTQEELRKIEGNAVILKRQEFLNKENDPNLERDHIIPLGLGGDNSIENLMYVSKEYHKKKTAFDNKLIRQLQSGEITRQEAQDQVKAWVEANPTEHFVAAEEEQKTYTYTDPKTGNEKTIDVSDLTPPKLTGHADLDKTLKASYNSKISTRKRQIRELYEAGQISADVAQSMLKNLETLKSSKSGSTKAMITTKKLISEYRKLLDALGKIKSRGTSKSLASYMRATKYPKLKKMPKVKSMV